MAKQAYLQAVDEANRPTIYLEDKKPIVIGRGPATAIKDTFCARNQVSILACFAENKVTITQLGRNPCTVKDTPVQQNAFAVMCHNDKMSLLQGKFSYVLKFDPPPGKVVSMVNDVSDSDEELPPAKMAKLESKSKIDAGCWSTFDNDVLIYRHPKVVNRSRIAAYDLDWTLICPKSNKKFPTDDDDWRILFNEVVENLAKEIKAGYKIVVFTNQARLINKEAVQKYQIKIQKIVERIGQPMEVYIAKGNRAKYRKPCTGMWDIMESRNGSTLLINRSESFFCGDAAGRKEGTVKFKGVPVKKSADHSQCDFFFARNIGLKFLTPEEHFLSINEDRPRKFTVFDPKTISYDVPLCDESKQVTSATRELVLLVGPPAAGKSKFANDHLVPAGYKRVNRDELKSMDLCFKKTEQHLRQGFSVVVDNTNGTTKARAQFLALAKMLNVPVRAFIMNIPIAHAKHNNKFRQIVDPSHEFISDIVINAYFKEYQQPMYMEGFDDVVSVNFWPVFKDSAHEKLYNLVLCEK